MTIRRSSRARLLWEVLAYGRLLASPTVDEEDLGGDMVRGTINYAWWYRPIVWLAFWLARPREDMNNGR